MVSLPPHKENGRPAKTDAELERIADQLGDLSTPDGSRRFLELCGELAGAEIRRLVTICVQKAADASARTAAFRRQKEE
jgi:hypothetical protein